jgi:hypothetical protein
VSASRPSIVDTRGTPPFNDIIMWPARPRKGLPMRPSPPVLKRLMRRRRGRRPSAVVDHIKADDGPEFQTLVKRIAELGFGQASFTKRSVTLDVSEYFVVMVDDLAGRQRIMSEKS